MKKRKKIVGRESATDLSHISLIHASRLQQEHEAFDRLDLEHVGDVADVGELPGNAGDELGIGEDLVVGAARLAERGVGPVPTSADGLREVAGGGRVASGAQVPGRALQL